MIATAKLTLSTCLLTLVISFISIQPASSLDTNSMTTNERTKRRSYYNPWSSPVSRQNSVSLYEASRVYRASPYTVPRPYYIPVYGTPGRPLIFYPPQPIYVNPGVPYENPLKPPYSGPSYLPPKESPHFTGGDKYVPPKEIPDTTTMPSLVSPRFGGYEETDKEDPSAPIWGTSQDSMVQMPLNGCQQKESGIAPTRLPITRPTKPTFIHNVQASSVSSLKSVQRSTIKTTTVSPPSGPSNCVWAIISCCSASDPSVVPQNCFEQRGCEGPFWDSSPCESQFARAAIASAVNYYNRNPGANMVK